MFTRLERVSRMYAGFVRSGAHSSGHASPALAKASIDRRDGMGPGSVFNPQTAPFVPSRPFHPPPTYAPAFPRAPHPSWALHAAPKKKGDGAANKGRSTASSAAPAPTGLGALAGLKGLAGSAAVPPPPPTFGDIDFAALQSGQLVEFVSQDKSRCALVQLQERAPDGKSWSAVDAAGAQYKVTDKEIDFNLSDELPPAAAPADLPALDRAARSLLSPPSSSAPSLAALWQASLAAQEGQQGKLSLPMIGALLAPDAPAAPATYAAYKLIAADRVFFQRLKRRPPTFKPRPKDQVETLLRRKEEAELESEVMGPLVARCFEALGAARADKPSKEAWLADARVGGVLGALEQYALLQDADLAVAAKERAMGLLKRLGRVQAPNYAAELLESIGYWAPHPDLPLLRSPNVRDAFPEAILTEADRVLAKYAESEAADAVESVDEPPRVDLTSQYIYTIDDAATTEIDDGLAVRRESHGDLRVWVHVADPTAHVRLDDALDQEARRRARTLYLPTRIVPMFPRQLADGPFSLRENLPSNALTLEGRINEQGELLEFDIYASRVVPKRKVTYVDADELLMLRVAEEQGLLDLGEAAARRAAYRQRSGCLTIDLPECKVTVRGGAEEPEVNVEAQWQQASPSRQLVAEMMILAGEIAGKFGAARMLPLPYRGQAIAAKPDPAELSKLPEGPARAMFLRRHMTRSINQCAPARHDGLGLDAYVQVTSPIRRYGDMLAHYQLKAYLGGRAGGALTGDQMSELVDQCALLTREGGRVEGECTNYWIAYYLAQQDPRRTYPAVMMAWARGERGLAIVLVTELGLELTARLTRASVAPGEALSLKLAFVEVRGGAFRMNEASTAEVEAWMAVQQQGGRGGDAAASDSE